MALTLRIATLADIPTLRALIAASARGLCAPDYTPEQIEAALRSAWGVDTQLIQDGTYFVAETADSEIAGCGGWSRRATLFGGDQQAGRSAAMLVRSARRPRRAFFAPRMGATRDRAGDPRRCEA